jgi:serine/threonine protein kinase
MNPERWRRIDELFRTVADRPPAEREAYLTRACGDDVELRREVLDLLDNEPPDTFIHDPIRQAALAVTSEPADELLGRRIGPYRLTRLIGRGGMGAVYEAVRDDDQFRQRVALKLIRRGMDSDFVRERFLRERQILASLEHPHIARLFDGGATADGAPYFVMEFVVGEPITEYCSRRDLSVDQKLKLFRDVCSAVQHAHQKLVVHRDLKPSNILVTSSAGGEAGGRTTGTAERKDGAPKLLDFGIAKLLRPDSGGAQTRTETAVRLLTPDYASPEQVRGGLITTATDVYALGVVLYELLTGRRPYQFETYAPLEIERVICDTEAARPSEAVSSSVKLARRLSGDLDNIVLMALRKDPARRYPTVEQFSDDLRRYLAGLPVTARPDTFFYRATKFARRHRVAVTAAALLLLSLVGGILATTLAARQARAERTRAERRLAQVRTLANTFLFDVHDKLQGVPGATEARGLVARTALEYLDNLSQEAAGDPELVWELAVAYQKVGDTQGHPWLANLGQPRAALQSYQKSLRLAQQLGGVRGDDLKTRRLLAQGYYKLGQLQAQAGVMAEAHEALRQAVALAEKLERQTHTLDDLDLLQNCYIRLGDTFMDSGDPLTALDCYRRTLQLSERRVVEFPGDQSRLFLAKDYSRAAEPLVSLGDVAGALANHRKSLALTEELLLSPGHAADPVYLRVKLIELNWLGSLSGNPRFINQGDARAALEYHRRSLALAERLPALEPKSALARQDLANAHRLMGERIALDRPGQSIEHFQKALALARGLLASAPGESPYLRWEARFLRGMAEPLLRTGDRAGALQALRQSTQICRELLSRDDNLRARAELHDTLLPLADQQLEAGEYDAALAGYREALALSETPPVDSTRDLYVRWRLADSCAGLGRYHAARAAAASAPADQRGHWQEARRYAQRSYSLWEGWGQQTGSTSFDRLRRERAARAVSACDAALSKLAASEDR